MSSKGQEWWIRSGRWSKRAGYQPTKTKTHSNVPYKIALDLLQVSPSEAVYVGDDPAKDFLGPNSMGILTIQVKRQTQQNSIPDTISETARARFVVCGLGRILPLIGGESAMLFEKPFIEINGEDGNRFA